MKKNILWIILALVFVAVFNVIFFITGAYKEADVSRWVGYGMIHFSYVLMVLMPIITAKSKTDRAFGIPISMLMVLYFALEFIASMIFILVNGGLTVQIIADTVITGLFVAAIVSLMIADTSAGEMEAQRNGSGDFKAKIIGILEKMQAKVNTEEINEILIDLYSEAVSAQAISNNSVEDIEKELISNIKDLEIAIEMNDNARAVKSGTAAKELFNKRKQFLG